jgi:hypothetical protein
MNAMASNADGYDFRLIAIDWANGICSDGSIIWFSYKRIVWVDPAAPVPFSV